MVNENYRNVDNKVLISNSNNVITEDDIDSFYIRCNSKLNGIIKRALNNLAKRKLINWEERTVICSSDGSHKEFFEANADERKQLLDVEFSVLEEFGCNSTAEIIYKRKSKEYYERVNDIILKEYGWLYTYKAYNIVFNQDNINNFIPRLEQSFEDAVLNLNKKIINALNKEADATYKRDCDEYNKLELEAAFDNEAYYRFQRMEKPRRTYVFAQRLLADELIDISDYYLTESNEVFDSSLYAKEIDKVLNNAYDDDEMIFEKGMEDSL